MNGIDKAALLLLSIGEHAAAQLMKHLDEAAVNNLSFAMSRIESLDRAQVDAVLTEFLTQVDNPPTQGVDSLQFIRDALVEAVGERKAEQVMEYIVRGDSMASTIDIVRRADTSMLTEQMRTERPQVIALLLAHLDPTQGAELLSRLPDDLAQEALYRYACLNTIRPQVLSELGGMLGEQLAAHVGMRRLADMGGPHRAADILNNLPASKGKALLDGVATLDAKLSDSIRESMFVFGDLAQIEPRALQTLLHEVPQEQLAAALKAATPEVTERLLANLSEHAREMVQEDLSFGRLVRRSEAERAQKAILQIARRLDAEGKIALNQNEEML